MNVNRFIEEISLCTTIEQLAVISGLLGLYNVAFECNERDLLAGLVLARLALIKEGFYKQ